MRVLNSYKGGMHMDKTLVEIDGLRLDYGAVCAVKDVSFRMKAGEILAVIGPNGSGKTSTVECVEGLRRPTSGSVQVFGVNPLKNRSQVYREMGIQLQEAEYPDKIKVKELCGLFSSFYENPADWHLLLQQLGLGEKAGRAVKKLSGGEKQRLSVLLALLPRPRLLILDELTTGLDPEIVLDSVRLVIDEFEQNGGKYEKICPEYQVPNTSWRVLKLILGTARLSNRWRGIELKK